MSTQRRAVRRPWVIATLALIALVIAAVVAIVAHRPDIALPPTLAQRQPDAARGAYVAVLGD